MSKQYEVTIKSGLNPVHPGEVLREELEYCGLSASALAKAMDVPTQRITEILDAERDITPDTAVRLGRYFDTTTQFWLNLQQTHSRNCRSTTRAKKLAPKARALSLKS